MSSLNISEPYKAEESRYESGMKFNKCGKSGLSLPALSLGFWFNFGGDDPYNESLAKMKMAFDNGIFCFDLANNYGMPFGTAEETFGRAFTANFRPYRREMVITTKAGYNMWKGPNGVGSSRKMLISSLETSLRKMNLDYVDIFYSHRYDSETPLEETMQALADIVHQGKAIYVGLSNYPMDKLRFCVDFLRDRGVSPVIYQGKYNMMVRDVEKEHLDYLKREGIGMTAFSPLAQGVLTGKYIGGVPSDSRIALGKYITTDNIAPTIMAKVRALNEIASGRNQTLAQMAISWTLARNLVTSTIIGPRTVGQLKDSIKAVDNINFTPEELMAIDAILNN